MAAVAGISEASVRRIWHARGLKPHRVGAFKLSNDPRFADKPEDIVGLYLNPPEHAPVLALEEKRQIQALDCTETGLPTQEGSAQTMTHDCKRHRTTTLFAALNALDGSVIATCMKHHRHQGGLSSCVSSTSKTPPTNSSTLSSTTVPPTNTRWFNAGRGDISAFIFTTHPPVAVGSTWSNESSAT